MTKWIIYAQDYGQTYGCEKPTTTKTLNNHVISAGTHDVTYSYVRFTGYSGSRADDQAVVQMNMWSGAPIYNITFDHCVFETMPAPGIGNAFHSWNNNVNDDVGLHHITFSHCWFEPQPRMHIEMNCFGGWQHHVTIDHCTFEPCVGEALSLCVVNESFLTNGGKFEDPWVPSINGVYRGFEDLAITNNDIRGTGIPDANFPDRTITEHWFQGVELAGVWDWRSEGKGASTFANNRIGRCRGVWLNCAAGGVKGMTFENNVFDDSYNLSGTDNYGAAILACGTYLEGCTFRDNTWILCNEVGKPDQMFYNEGIARTNLTFIREHYVKTAGSFHYGGPWWYFTDSTYTDCHFQLPQIVYFPESASGTGCVFDNGHTGGTFT